MPELFCILEEGGRALLTKAQGGIQLPSFPTIGLLSSVAAYIEGAGYSLETLGTTNVRVVYRRFPYQLLFVLATSNLLVHPDTLQTLLQVVYDALLLLLGKPALALESPGSIEDLRKKLRGLQCLDTLVIDDALVPCLMLLAPQVMGLPLRDKAALQSALGKLAAAASTKYAALISDGYFLEGTADWWTLQPKEALLLQYIATHTPEEATRGLMVHLHNSAGEQVGQPLSLVVSSVEQGVQLLLLCSPDVDAAVVQAQVERVLQGVRSIFQMPIWCVPPLPQFQPISFDLALVAERSSAGTTSCITLLWGHTSLTPAGFNPLMSPTLRKQLDSPVVGQRSDSLRAMALARESNPDHLQLYFKSVVDLTVAFMLQCMQQAQPPPPSSRAPSLAQRVSHSRAPGAGPASPSTPRRAAAQQGGGAAWGAVTHTEEMHIVTAANRLTWLMDPAADGVDVFVCFQKGISRQQALESAQKLRAIYYMVYSNGD